MWRRRPRQKLGVLGRHLQARVEKPQQLAPNLHTLFMGVADIDQGRIRKVVGHDLGQPSLRARLTIRGPGALGPLLAAQD